MEFLNINKNNYFILSGLLLAFVFIALPSCNDEENFVKDREWQLVWEDNFEGTAGTALDPANWAFDVGAGCDRPAGCGWGNMELQYYTDRTENVSLDGNGNLAITALRESFAGSPFTSGRITTKGLFEQAYGRFEARIKLPWGPGIWPAFWLLGANEDVATWPQNGEIDIMEYRGQEPNIIHGSLHGPGYSGGSPITKSFGFENDRFDTDFHVFAVEWGEGFIHFYVDDVLYQEVTPDDAPGQWVYDHSFYILLNVAVGGNYVGFPTSQTNFPQSMLVDYVRVFREVNN